MKTQTLINISNIENLSEEDLKDIYGGSELSDKINELIGSAAKVYKEVTSYFVLTNKDPLGNYWGK